ncbi:unnamed protein product [Brugia timori]|uniref:Transposase n=1 Tax=Brugia timori TaxID=42155 RepID=A0A0R3QI91_9BILA|nr:unnamed protein product [Brugia timori]
MQAIYVLRQLPKYLDNKNRINEQFRQLHLDSLLGIALSYTNRLIVCKLYPKECGRFVPKNKKS